MYTAILFDLDGTLIDFDACGSLGQIFQPALGRIHRHFPLGLGKPISAEAFQVGFGPGFQFFSDRLFSSLAGTIGHFNYPKISKT